MGGKPSKTGDGGGRIRGTPEGEVLQGGDGADVLAGSATMIQIEGEIVAFIRGHGELDADHFVFVA